MGSVTVLAPIERMRSFQVGASALEDEIAKLQREGAPGPKAKAPAAAAKRPAEKAKLAVPMKRVSAAAAASEELRSCTNCGRYKTPQWRIGPLGPKSLCNACGVHYRKFKQLPKFNVTFKPPSGAAPVGAAPPKT